MWRTIALSVAVALALPGFGAAPTRAGGRTWTALAGGYSPDAAVTANAYFPKEFEIGVGDTVTWEIWGFHTVTFPGGGQSLPSLVVDEADRPHFRVEARKVYYSSRVFLPYGSNVFDGSHTVNSGVSPSRMRPSTFSITFTKPGRWYYVCLVHWRHMSGTVIVTDSPRASPDEVAALAAQQRKAALQKGQAQLRSLAPQREGSRVILPLVGSTEGGYSVLRFTREPLVIPRGRTVTWTMRDAFEYHTVTFHGKEPTAPFVVEERRAEGPPRLRIHPRYAERRGATYDGVRFANSGLLVPAGFPGPSEFSLAFTRPDRYEYVCMVHLPEMMKGTVVVK